MTEASLKGELVKMLRLQLPGYVVIRHEDRFTHGIPDISVTGSKVTTWIEVKFANPDFASKGIQDLTLTRLAVAGHAVFVVYYIQGVIKRTYIVEPKEIALPINNWLNYMEGINHLWVVEQIKKGHNEYYNG